MVQAGGSYKITSDIVIGDQVAFRAGETVAVEAISPNPQKPEYQYVVLSPSLNQRFQLRDVDLAEIGKGVAYPAQPVRESARKTPQKKIAPKRRWRGTAIVMLVMLVVGAVGGFVLAKVLDSSSEESATSANQTSPKKQGSSTPSTSTPSGSQSAVSQIGPKPDLSKPDPNASGYLPGMGNPITKAQYDLLKGGMSQTEVYETMGKYAYEANTTTSTITLTDASRTIVPVIVCDWKIEGDPQGYAKAKLVDDKLVEKSWNPSTGEPSWEVY